MNQPYTFHETARGYNHILRGVPCEDYSDSFSSADSKFHIAVVADGHGAKECFRSASGSKFAVNITINCLKNFAENILKAESKSFYEDFLSNPRSRQEIIQRLTDTIIASWVDIVLKNYEKNPPTDKELSENIEKSQLEKNIPHIYGTTLIAALLLPKCLILVQQGDGRCVVFYNDGSYNQPIPWDSRCEENVTTSLCDADANLSIRSVVLDLEDKKVAACFLGSDGVEDTYRDTYEDLGKSHSLMGGVYTFYKNLSVKFIQNSSILLNNSSLWTGRGLRINLGWNKNQKSTIRLNQVFLKEMLLKFSKIGLFSKTGSGDDVSVAGIVDFFALKKLEQSFKKDIELYELEEKLFLIEEALKSKKRKYGILKKRVEDAKKNLEEKNHLSFFDIAKNVNIEKENIKDNILKFNRRILEFRALNEIPTDQKKVNYETKINDLETEKKEHISKLNFLNNKTILNQNERDKLEENFEFVKKEFDEYNAEFQKIYLRRDEILKQIEYLKQLI